MKVLGGVLYINIWNSFTIKSPKAFEFDSIGWLSMRTYEKIPIPHSSFQRKLMHKAGGFLLLLLLFCFGFPPLCTGNRTQCLTHTRQELYH